MYGSKDTESPTKVIKVSADERKKQVLTDEEILSLAKWSMAIEEHYSQKLGRFTPMDIEWAKDGELNQLFIVQARPETVHSRRSDAVLEIYHLKQPGTTLVTGLAVGSRIGAGRIRVLEDVTQMAQFQPGEVLVADMTDPDWEPIMKKAAAIVTNKGGRTCHAAIVSRELGIPAVVGTGDALEMVQTGQEVTVSCAEGERGRVYRGLLEFDIERIDLEHLPQPRTLMMMNVGNPEKAFDYSHIPNRGVGLAREEFIIASTIKIHPLALLQYEAVIDRPLRDRIDELTFGYEDKAQFYVDRLAEGVAKIAAAYYPHDVIVRFSDFKSNEYANLLGGELFEPKEENPMIGWRGASRYYAPKFKAAFGLECKAIRRVREEMGLSNVKVMVPFCRTPEEGQKVIEVMSEYGLRRGEPKHAPLQVYVMAELPSNILLADEFA
ncbi:MAG: phosphoenolpyruvate synthase, partial [Methylocella sp.]